MNKQAGSVFIVATPIGNLRDISERAIETLKKVDLILAEDTRHAGILLSHHGISSPTRSFHEHNEEGLVSNIITQLQGGRSIALISDAGTPLISDPGYRLVSEAVKHGITVSPIPGACAITASLSASGLATDRFCFEGFLPAKSHGRNQRLTMLKDEPRTLIFYESSHRIIDCLGAIHNNLGDDRQICVAREISKKFETFYHGNAQGVLQQLTDGPQHQKGEFVVIVSGAKGAGDAEFIKATHLLTQLIAYMPLKKASQIAAQTFNCNRNQLYEAGLKMKNGE